MTQRVYLVILLLCLRLMYPLVTGIFMDKLASKKLCADDDCVYTISLVRAEEDYNAPDCRFINIKKGQLIYVYSKLVKEKESGEFWAGSVYGEEYEDHMGTVGYFPSSLVSEQHVYQEANKTVPTTVCNTSHRRVEEEGPFSQADVVWLTSNGTGNLCLCLKQIERTLISSANSAEDGYVISRVPQEKLTKKHGPSH